MDRPGEHYSISGEEAPPVIVPGAPLPWVSFARAVRRPHTVRGLLAVSVVLLGALLAIMVFWDKPRTRTLDVWGRRALFGIDVAASDLGPPGTRITRMLAGIQPAKPDDDSCFHGCYRVTLTRPVPFGPADATLVFYVPHHTVLPVLQVIVPEEGFGEYSAQDLGGQPATDLVSCELGSDDLRDTIVTVRIRFPEYSAKTSISLAWELTNRDRTPDELRERFGVRDQIILKTCTGDRAETPARIARQTRLGIREFFFEWRSYGLREYLDAPNDLEAVVFASAKRWDFAEASLPDPEFSTPKVHSWSLERNEFLAASGKLEQPFTRFVVEQSVIFLLLAIGVVGAIWLERSIDERWAGRNEGRRRDGSDGGGGGEA